MKRFHRQPGPSAERTPAEKFRGFHKDGPEDPLIGESLDGGLRIASKIGSGGTSSVYLAMGPEGRKAAAKVASTRLDPDLMNRLVEHEGELLSRLSHPNIIRCDGTGSIHGRRYILLEHLDGTVLANSLDRRTRLSWTHLRSVMMQLCDALDAIHSAGIVHRDVKARNIFLNGSDEAETVKLLDLGLAKEAGREDQLPKGSLPGTAITMAPEIINGLDFDHRADIYSCGVLMYSLLCGSVPFSGSTESILAGHLHQAPIAPREMHPYLEIPYAIEDIVMRALSKKPEDRFQSASEMRAAIEACTYWHRDIALIDGVSWSRILRLDSSGTDDD